MIDYEIASGACAATSSEAARVLADAAGAAPATGQDVVNGAAVPATPLVVTYSGWTIEPQLYAAQLAGPDAKLRDRLESTFNQEIYRFDHFKGGSAVAKYSLVDTRAYFVESAYAIFDGEILPDDGSGTVLARRFATQMMRRPIGNSKPAAKEYYRERYVVDAVNIEVLGGYFRYHHDEVNLRKLRAAARQALTTDLGSDPASFSLKRIVCSFQAPAGTSCAAHLHARNKPL